MFDASKIPGMIEKIEQENLVEIASRLQLEDGCCIVEFGPFMGRSTACIAEGLLLNPTRSDNVQLHTFDSFRCHRNGGFIQHVRKHADRYSVSNLIQYIDDYADFENVFRHFMSRYITCNVLKVHKSELENSVLPISSGDIKMMHIDSPKFYSELRYILLRSFPRLRLGSKVIFQDFFYQWSATLIAAVGHLISIGVLRPIATAATSLTCDCIRIPTLHELVELDLNFEECDKVIKGIFYADESLTSIKQDRPHIFHPRLLLAKGQYLFSIKKENEARRIISEVLFNSHGLHQDVFHSFLDLAYHKFDIRSVYREDHDL